MQLDTEFLRQHYAAMSDEELREINRDDLVDAAVRALERRATGILNVGTARETSILDLARRLCALAGVDPAGIRHQDAIPGEQRRSVLDPGRARAALGWEPRTTLDQGLAATWAWFQGHP